MIWKLSQISRLAGKSLLCNVSMNTCLDDRASRGGSVISVGTLPLRRTTQWCITLQKTQRKYQRVRKCPLKYLNPPEASTGRHVHRTSKQQSSQTSRKPLVTRQFPDTAPGIQVLKRQKSYSIPRNIRNSMGTIRFLVREV